MLDLKSLIPWGQKHAVPAKQDGTRDPFLAFRSEVDRLFDDFFGHLDGSGGRALNRFGADSLGTPNLDVSDGDKELVVSAELPGVDENDFEVTLAGDVLTISGEKKHEHEEKDGERRYVERSYGSFSRSLRLPFEAGEEDISADFDKGVLTVRIPKPANAQNNVKRIEVRTH